MCCSEAAEACISSGMSVGEHIITTISSARMRILPLTRDQRAFGFDRRVIQLNYDIDWECDWPAPHLVSRVIHSVAHPLKEAVRAVFFGAKSLVRRLKRSRVDEEAGAREKKSTEGKAMDEYRRKLEETFGSSRGIGYVMVFVRAWINDVYGE